MNKGLVKWSLFSLLLLTAIIILGFYIIPALSDAGISSYINVTLQTPSNMYNVSSNKLNFSYTAAWNSTTAILSNCTLYTNFSSAWVPNVTNQTTLSNTTNNWINITTVAGDGTYIWNVYCFNATNNGTVYDYDSTNRTLTIDTTSPKWSGNVTNNTATYSSSTPSLFNVTWIDNTTLTVVYIEIGNSTGVLINNASMSNSYGDGVYNYSIVLPAGNWYWKAYASDSANNWNTTDNWTFTVNKATPTLNVYIDGNASDKTIAYPLTANASANETNNGDSDCTYTLNRNGTALIPGSNVWNVTTLGNNTWMFNYSMSGTCTNWTISTSQNLFLYVNKGSLTGALSTPNATYPNNLTMTATESNSGDSDVNYTIYCNNTLVNLSTGLAPSGTYQFGVNYYSCILNTTSETFTNWTSNSSIITNTTYVNKGDPSSYINMYLNNTTTATVTYPLTAEERGNVSTITGAGDLTFVMYYNVSSVGSGNATNQTVNSVQLGNDTWTFVYNTSGGTNWTSGSSSAINLYVNKGTPTLNVYIDGNNSNETINYPATANISGNETNSGDSDCVYNLWRNETPLVNGTYSNLWNYTSLGNGTYGPFKYNMSGTCSNWTLGTSSYYYLFVNKGNPTSTMNISINGTANDSTVTYPNATNVTGWSTITGQAGLTFNLYKSGAFVNNTTSAPYMIDDENFFGVNTYTYIFNTTGNANYTNGTVTRTLTISQGTPSISLTSSSWSVTYGTATTVTCSVSTPTNETNITLLRNGTIVNSTENGISYTLTVGPWNYTCNSSASTNYSASSQSNTLTVNAAAITTTTSGSTGGFTSSTITSTTVRLAQGKVNITADKITTDGKMIANIAKYQDVAIRGMNITVVNNVANIKIMTSKLATLPASVPYDINGKVYNYISVDKVNITDADIKIVNISFAVNKTWLTANNVDSSNITLYRWANNKWNDLSASKISEDANEVFFRVSSPGLSVFVIGTKGGAPVITPTPTTCTESWSCTDWSTCANNQQTRTCTDANSCGTTASKPSESQSCTVNKGETTVVTPVQTSILTTVIVIVVAVIACVFIFLERTKISSYLTTITKKSKNHKKTSYLESLARKIDKVEEEEEEKLNVSTD